VPPNTRSAMQHGAEALFQRELAEVFEFAGIEEDAMTAGAAIDHDMKLLLVFDSDEQGVITRTLSWSGGIVAGARAMDPTTIGFDCFDSKIGIVLGEFVEFAGIEPDAAAGGAAVEGDFEWCADAEADGFHDAGVGGAGEFPAILTRDEGHAFRRQRCRRERG
jgi:hypothetical protein